MNIPYFIETSAMMAPEKTAIFFYDREVSYRGLNDRTNQVANALIRAGVSKGEHVAFLLRNSPEVAEVYLGIIKAGAVSVPLNYMFSSEKLAICIRRADVKALFYDTDFSEKMDGIQDSLPSMKALVSMGQEGLSGSTGYEVFIQDAAETIPQVDINEDDASCLFFTAGATGEPKMVMVTHGQTVWSAMNALLTMRHQSPVTTAISPMFHVASLGVLLTTLMRQASCAILRGFDPQAVMNVVSRHKVTNLFLVPTMWVRLLDMPDIEEYDRSSVKIVSSAGSGASPQLKERILKAFPNAGFSEVYGMTEMSAVGTVLEPWDEPEYPGSVGRPALMNRMRIVDEMGRDLPAGEVGEIIFQGPGMMKGYYRDEDATRRAIRHRWYHTNDLGRVDGKGYLYLMGRKDEMIISGAENIYPLPIEKALNQHSKVLEAVVIGAPDEEWGEVVLALVIQRPGEKLEPDELINYCRDKLGGHMKPRRVEFVDSLPKTETGKVYKPALREKYGKM